MDLKTWEYHPGTAALMVFSVIAGMQLVFDDRWEALAFSFGGAVLAGYAQKKIMDWKNDK